MLVGESTDLGQGFDVIASAISSAAQAGFSIYKGLTEMKAQKKALKEASAMEMAAAKAAADQAAAYAAAARAQQQQGQTQMQFAGLPWWAWVAIAGGGVLLLGGGAYLLLRKPRPAAAPAA